MNYKEVINEAANRIFRAELDIDHADFAPCPLHKDDTSSLKVYPNGSFFCFGCQKGGDLIKFVRERYGLSFREALEYLNSNYTLGIDSISGATDEVEQETVGEKRVQETLQLAVLYFHKTLMKNQKALDYLVSRGLSISHIETRKMGLCPMDYADIQTGLVAGEMTHLDRLNEAGLTAVNTKGGISTTLGGRVIFPHYAPNGDVIDLVGRRTDTGKGMKYKRLRATQHLHGIHLLNRPAKRAIVCEGIIDREILEQLGFVALSPGGIRLGEDAAKVLTKVSELYICFDNEKDGHGERGAIAAGLIMAGLGHTNVKVMTIPRADDAIKVDVASYWIDHCKEDSSVFIEEMRALIASAEPIVDYMLTRIPKDIDRRSMADAISPLLSIVARLDEFSQLHYRDMVAKYFNIPKTTVSKNIRQATPVRKEEERIDKVFEEGEKYMIKTYDADGNPVVKQISNFVVRLRNILIGPEGVERIVQLVNDRGQTSETFALSGEDVALINRFKPACMSRGNFLFEGSPSDLNDLMKLLFTQKAPFIYQPTQIGYVDGVWVFSNCGIDGDGNVVPADENGTIWLNNKGYQPSKIYVNEGDDTNTLPSFDLAYLAPSDSLLVNVAETLRDSLGGYEAYMALGWTVASMYSHHLFKRYHCFPYLFLAGKRQSGKSVLGSWLQRFFGLDIEDGKSIRTSTVVGINRRLAYFSSVPSWYDEYRGGDKNVQSKEGFLRGVFNRQSADKGIKAAFGLRSERIRGTMLLSGEEVPEDNAMRSRCVILHLSEHKRNPALFRDMVALTNVFPEIGLHWMRDSQNKDMQDAMFSNIAKVSAYLEKMGMDNRTANINAMVAGGFLTAFGNLLTEEAIDEFLYWVSNSVSAVAQALDDEHPINMFWEDVVSMMAMNFVTLEDLRIERGRYLYLPTNYIFDKWGEYCKRVGKSPMTKQAWQDYMKEEPYHVKGDTKYIKNLGAAARCLCVDLDHASMNMVKERLLKKEEF